MLRGEPGHDRCTQDVVLQGLGGLGLHHRHVLMGGGMQDDPGLKADKDLAHAVDVRDVAHDGRDERAGAGGDELLLGLV